MPTDWKGVAIEAARETVRVVFPLGDVILKSLDKSTTAVEVASNKSIEALREEVAKQEIRLEFDLKQAKIAQEMAIAQRILNAHVVEIEEFYDRSASGYAGVKGDETNISFGLGGDGKSVVRRVYKFTAEANRVIDGDADQDTPSAADKKI